MSHRTARGLRVVSFCGLAVAGLLAGVVVRSPNGTAAAVASPAEGWVRVERRDLITSLVESGELQSAEQTEVDVKLESLGGPSGGIFGAPQASRIMSLIPDGSAVKKGDVLCKLDTTAHERELHTQELDLAQAEAMLAAAKHDLDRALIDLKAFEEGERPQELRRFEVALTLASAEHGRAAEWHAWNQRLHRLGYLSPAELGESESSRLQAGIEAERQAMHGRIYRVYSVPKIRAYLASLVDQAKNQHEYAVEFRDQARTRRDHLRTQVEHGTLRAPHDGYVIYADLFYRVYYQIAPGAEVHTGQVLFLLPNLHKPIVEIGLPETVARHVVVGQPATVTLAAMPNLEFPARVSRVDVLPQIDWRTLGATQEIQVRVELEKPDIPLLPDQSATVRIMVGVRPMALCIPTAALGRDRDGLFCLVRSGSEIVRRAVEVERGDSDWIVVTSGLEEGDEVALNPQPDPRRLPLLN